MNLNINKLITRILPFVVVLLLSFLIGRVSYILLPKESIEFTKENIKLIEYKSYKFSDAFVEKNTIDNQTKEKNIKTQKADYTLNENIILESIFQVGDDGGFAVIVEKGKRKTHLISKNEFFKQYELVSIKAEYVVFEKAGKLYKLEMKSSDKKNSNNKNYYINDSSDKPHIEKRSDTSYAVKRKDLISYSKNLKKLWNDIGIKTYKENGRTVGFSVYKLKKNSVFTDLGLKRGDIMTEANGMPLNNYQNAFALFNKINTLEQLRLKIIRANEEMELEYEVK